MAQIINDPYSGNIFGRIGAGIGQGLNEQLPKEIERGRLASGLKKLNSQNIKDPLEYFTKAVTVPGVTPQMVASLGQLAKQRLQNESARDLTAPNLREGGSAPSLDIRGGEEAPAIPSITTRGPLEETRKPFINPTGKEINEMVDKVFTASPGYFNNDRNEARAYVKDLIGNEATRSQQLIQKRANEQEVQNNLLGGFRNYLDKRNINQPGGIDIPRNELEPLEQQLIKSLDSVQEGGKGFVEEQAARFFENEADKIARDYSALRKLAKSNELPSDIQKQLEPLRKKFESRGRLENFADELTGILNVSPRRAYSLAYPIKPDSPIAKEYKRLPTFNERVREAGASARLTPSRETEKIAPFFADLLGDNSPLAVADLLTTKGYDPNVFLDYIAEHAEDLGLTDTDNPHSRELEKARKPLGSLGNIFHQAMGVK